MKEKVLLKIESIRREIKDLSMYIYNNPEVAMQEYKSCEKLVAYLKEKGFEVEEKLAGMETAFKATVKNGNGPKIALCAEYDALAYGHACGHHLICAASIAAGIGIAEALKKYEGEVSIIGTPAEEIGEGKPYLIEKGVFDNYDIAMMVHPYADTCIEPIVTTIGGYDFTFLGKTSHAGAKPFEGINALDAIICFYNNISVLRQQLKDGTRIHGIILEGGDVVNSIPDRCKIRYEIRTSETDYFEKVVEKVITCAKAAAMATGCELEYEPFERVCSGLKRNKILANLFRRNMDEFGIVENPMQLNGGSTDMGDVSQIIPSLHPMIKFVKNNEDVHTKEFLASSIEPYAFNMLINSAKTLAMTGLEILKNSELVNQIKEEHTN